MVKTLARVGWGTEFTHGGEMLMRMDRVHECVCVCVCVGRSELTREGR